MIWEFISRSLYYRSPPFPTVGSQLESDGLFQGLQGVFCVKRAQAESAWGKVGKQTTLLSARLTLLVGEGRSYPLHSLSDILVSKASLLKEPWALASVRDALQVSSFTKPQGLGHAEFLPLLMPLPSKQRTHLQSTYQWLVLWLCMSQTPDTSFSFL